jgi:hypothetical protein
MNIGKWLPSFELASPGRIVPRLRLLAWSAAVCAGFLEVWAARFWLSPDGNTYLDIASSYLRADWKNAVNAYWSPLFSWLLAFCLAIFHPSSYWESTLLHLLNFVAFLLSLLTFEFFFRAFLRARKQFAWAMRENEDLSETGWWVLGYGLFFSTSLFVLPLNITTPDICVAVWTFLVAGLILRISTSSGSPALFALLGLTLACAYLTKSFYFPMSFVFLLTAWLASGAPRKTLKHAVIALAIFILVAGPWVFVVSRAKHRLTFGDVGKLAFAITVDQIQQSFFWQGENQTGIPQHPVRQLLTKPRLYEFATPVAGTYPPSYDPSYWMEGAKPHFSLTGQLRVFRQSAGTIFKCLVDQIEYIVGLLFLLFLLDDPKWPTRLRQQWFLWLPPLLACLSYSLVLVEGRYIAPFLLLIWIAAFSFAASSTPALSSRNALALALAILSVTTLRAAKFTASDFLTVLAKRENADFEIAEGLHVLGIQPGDKAASMARMADVHWARLAGIKIVSEIPLGEENVFWTASASEKAKVFNALARTGAKVLVTKNAPPSAVLEGWIPLAETGFYAYRLISVPPKNLNVLPSP